MSERETWDRNEEERIQKSILKWLPGLCRVVLIMAEIAVVARLNVRAETGTGQYERRVEQEVTYEDVEDAANIPREISVEVQDGDQETVTVCNLERVEELESRWMEGFELPLTFHMYDADTYMLENRRIPRNDDKPQILDCEAELLSMAGLSPSGYRITDVQWNGGIYEDADGAVCRDAMATGQKKVGTYLAAYAGTAVFAEIPGYLRETAGVEETVVIEETSGESTESPAEEVAAGTTVPEIVPEPVFVPDEKEQETAQEASLWERIVQVLRYAVGVGAVLVILGLVLLAALYMAKKFRLWYDRRKRKSSQRR